MEAFEVLSLVLALWLAAALYSYRRLRHFSGPWLASVSKLWMMRSTYGGRMHLDVADVCKKYGTAWDLFLSLGLSLTSSPGHLARIGPNDLVTDDPEIIRKINAVRSPYTRSDWYNATAFSHRISHVFCERDEQRHLDLRNKLIPGVGVIPHSRVISPPSLRPVLSTPAKKTCISNRALMTSWLSFSASSRLDTPRRSTASSVLSTWPACVSS
jgi:hypothetical protein